MLKKLTLLISFSFIFAGLVYGQTAKSTLDGLSQSYNGEMNASATYVEYAKVAKIKA